MLLRIVVDIIFFLDLFYNVLNKVFEEFFLLCIEIEEMVLLGVNLMFNSGNVDIVILFFIYFMGFSEDFCEIEFVVVVYFDYLLYVFDRLLILEDFKFYW